MVVYNNKTFMDKILFICLFNVVTLPLSSLCLLYKTKSRYLPIQSIYTGNGIYLSNQLTPKGFETLKHHYHILNQQAIITEAGRDAMASLSSFGKVQYAQWAFPAKCCRLIFLDRLLVRKLNAHRILSLTYGKLHT